MIIGSNFYTAAGLFVALVLMLLGLFSTYPAIRACEKGRNFMKWYVFSFLLFPIALVASLIIDDSKEPKL